MKLKKSLVVLAVLGIMAAAGFRIYAHCEIPCGIYDDPMRMKMIHEHIMRSAILRRRRSRTQTS